MEERRLVRSRDDRMIGGVCSGLAAHFGIDPTLVRFGFVLLLLAGFGSSALVYLALWVIMPLEGREDATSRATVESNMQEMVDRTREVGSSIKEKIS